jgi:hypothetical protein
VGFGIVLSASVPNLAMGVKYKINAMLFYNPTGCTTFIPTGVHAMDKSENEDFNTILQRHSFKRDDFNIIETDTTQWNPNEIVPTTGTILITLKKTNKSKTYRTGMGTRWLIEFENDLKNSVFS